MPDGTYAPQSPDLSSFLTSSSPQKKAPTSSYAPKSPNLSNFPTAAASPFRAQQPQGLGLNPSYQSAPQQSQYQLYNEYNEYNQTRQSYLPQIPSLPPSHTFSQQQQQQLGHPYHTGSFGPDPNFTSQPPIGTQSQVGYASGFPTVTQGEPDMATRGKRGVVKSENGTPSGLSRDLGPSKGIEIKTKFPVARIKRIMQADEEVGKVAQVTPVAVSKALELFMIAIVTRSAEVAKAKNSKRVTAQHLKNAIDGEEQFDFLNDIVSRVADGPDAGGKRVKSEDDSEDEDMEKSGGRVTKKAKGRRKKGE